MVGVRKRIPGTAFFPGGAGLWQAGLETPLPPMPIGGVMVLGQDFHSEEAFEASLAERTEVPERPSKHFRIPPTWIELRRLLAEAEIPLERCFFTNAFMGLRRGNKSVGRFPGALDDGYVDRCRQFLLRQLTMQRPSVVLTLGIWVPGFIAPLSPQLAGWRKPRTMRAIDDAGPIVRAVQFPGSTAGGCVVIALTHPSLRAANVGRRRFGDNAGHAAEIAMLREQHSTTE